MNDENLYINVKNKICEQIFKGIYKEGERIPAERVLAESLDVSRVTLRKALELLEQENLIVREVGSGTRVCLHNYGVQGSLDMIVLVAPAKNPFFSEFIARFQAYAEEQEAMLLYVEKPGKESLENCLYRLYQKGLQNVIIWLEDLPVEEEKLKRLRALGMNMVFFDTDKGLPYADCVALDNEEAIKSMCAVLKQKGCADIGYIGWDRKDMYSIAKREKIYIREMGSSRILLRLPWEQRHRREEIVLAYLREHQTELPDAIICGDRDNGIAVSDGVQKLKLFQISVAAIDGFPEAKKRGVITYMQNLDESAKQIFACLAEQNQKGREWKADLHLVPGL